MKLRKALLTIANRYCAAKQLSRGRVSTIVFNSGMTLDRIDEGKNFTNKSYETALTYFSDNWPEGVEWPENIVRPPNFVGANVAEQSNEVSA
ncbi:hypothetical protein [uncultured Maritalea sp.]|uniref:hypothetical protein n=1 Tax=uncultured Maritalea sp. TaxID=757249 RepID=UPI00260BF7E4|nr:hypothetical protein [uncultured Maritalea sp.]